MVWERILKKGWRSANELPKADGSSLEVVVCLFGVAFGAYAVFRLCPELQLGVSRQESLATSSSY